MHRLIYEDTDTDIIKQVQQEGQWQKNEVTKNVGLTLIEEKVTTLHTMAQSKGVFGTGGLTQNGERRVKAKMPNRCIGPVVPVVRK